MLNLGQMMPKLEQIAMAAASTINPELAAQAKKELNKYSRDKAGLKKLINDKGGSIFLDEAVNYASSAPKVKAWFDRFGVDPHDLKNTVMQDLQHSETAKPAYEASPVSSSLERLKRLK